MRKVCTKCGIEKELTEFNKDKKGKLGVRGDCKKCHMEQKKEHYKNNREKVLGKRKEYRKNNKEKIAEHVKKHYENNKEKIIERKKEYKRKRRKNDPVYRMIENYRTRTFQAYKQGRKSKGTIELLGCTGIELANHLEEQFKEGMTHDNYGEWHIDHIKPIASFDLSDPEQEQECFHYTNLQPLWAEDNLKKGDKL